jgi:hypothetical protein
MKPRLKSAPATDEDSEIWLNIVAQYMEDWATVGVIFRDADRRDADLMHTAQQLRWSWLVQVGIGDWHLVRSKETARLRDPVWQAMVRPL